MIFALTTNQYIYLFKFIISMFVLLRIIPSSIQKNITAYKETKIWNWARTFIILVFMSLLVEKIFRFITLEFNFVSYTDRIVTEDSLDMSYASIATASMVLFGAMLAFYVNKQDYLMFGPLAFYGSAITFWLLTGIGTYHTIFIIAGGLVALISMFQAGISLKDNDALGLALAFLFMFLSAFAPNEMVDFFFELPAWIIFFMMSIEKWHPYRK